MIKIFVYLFVALLKRFLSMITSLWMLIVLWVWPLNVLEETKLTELFLKVWLRRLNVRHRGSVRPTDTHYGTSLTEKSFLLERKWMGQGRMSESWKTKTQKNKSQMSENQMSERSIVCLNKLGHFINEKKNIN